MYHQHFELTLLTHFSIAPDPHFLYMSERHREALAHLEWGLWAGGFVLLTGEVGTGKTTLCRCLLERIPDDTDVAFVINPRVTAAELLITICEELGDAPPEAEQDSVKKLVDRINGHLIEAHARNKRVVLVIDEAQNLSFDVLEQVRLLTNLETDARKLLQVILLGQPELLEMLEAPELRQLAQRVTARYHLLLSRDGHNVSAGAPPPRHRRGATQSVHPGRASSAAQAGGRHSEGCERNRRPSIAGASAGIHWK